MKKNNLSENRKQQKSDGWTTASVHDTLCIKPRTVKYKHPSQEDEVALIKKDEFPPISRPVKWRVEATSWVIRHKARKPKPHFTN